MVRLLIVCFFGLASVLALSACSGCEDECPDGCAEGEVCIENQCVPTSAMCAEPCGDGEECLNGVCITRPQTCDTVGVVCDPLAESADGFVCVDLDGPGPDSATCLSNCGTDGACEAGSLCFFVTTPLDEACGSDADCDSSRVCQQGACRETICRPSECEGFLTGIETCQDRYDGTGAFPYDAICAEVGNEASFCFSGGPREKGEACVDHVDAIDAGEFSAVCAPGLGCIDGVCQTACTEDTDCDSEESCLLAEDDFLGQGVGFCAAPCTPFVDDAECSESATCVPVAQGEGLCIQAGAIAAFEDCTPGVGGCESGTLCIELESGAGARCMPLCDVNAGPANPDGRVSDASQVLRDATCPNPPPALAGLQFLHLAGAIGPIDIYLDDEESPTFEDMTYGVRSDGDSSGTAQFFEIEAGNMSFRVLPAGAPRTDPEILSGSLALASGQGTTPVILASPGASDAASFEVLDSMSLTVPDDALVRVGHGAVDLGAFVLVAVPEGDDLTDPATQILLPVVNSPPERSSELLPVGIWDLLVFEESVPIEDRANALAALTAVEVESGDRVELFLAGTQDPEDLSPLELVRLDYQPTFSALPAGPTYTCVDLDNGAFGFCQQQCRSPGAYGRGDCEGDGMGCTPQFVNGPAEFRSLCAPVGSLAEGDLCDPLTAAQCREGLYCLEYGNTVAGFDASRRGRCTSLCLEDAQNNSPLECDPSMACNPVTSDPGFSIGECGFACDPDGGFSDSECPEGLKACLPSASLVDAPDNPSLPPTVQLNASFCSAAGDVATGANCAGPDCSPESECLYDRSDQPEFINSLLSAYVGMLGQQPVCKLRCDPFDQVGACESDETCLFNFPFSADVGHCAPIVEDLPPDAPCTQPGQACGQDSICVANGGENICLRFCQYLGPENGDGVGRSTCSTGLECQPFVADIGICRPG